MESADPPSRISPQYVLHLTSGEAHSYLLRELHLNVSRLANLDPDEALCKPWHEAPFFQDNLHALTARDFRQRFPL